MRLESSFLLILVSPLSREELAAGTRRVRAVDRRMAVVARAGHEAGADARVGLSDAVRLAVQHTARRGGVTRGAIESAGRAVDRARMPRPVVAVLAQIRRRLVQEPRVDRPMRVVASDAVLFDRRMAEDIRTALVGVARVALVV